jgi:hypothetical protein
MGNMRDKIVHELKVVSLVCLYFGSFVLLLALLKQLILEEYSVEARGLSVALIGALVLSKVVLVLEHVPISRWLKGRPVWMGLLFRTTLYALGVIIILLLEKAVSGRHEHGGFWPSLMSVFRHPDIYHVWYNAICLSVVLLGYNVLFIVRCHLGKGGLRRMFLSPLSREDAEG